MRPLIFVSFILCGFSHLAQTERLLSCSNFFGSISIQTNKGNYSIRFFNEKSVETSFNFTSISDTTISHAVIAKPQLYKWFIDRNGNHTQTVYLKENVLNGISIGVDSIPFNITYYYGSRRLFSQNDNNSEEKKFKLQLKISPEEVLYGGGSRALSMNRRGNKLELYNRAHYGYETNAPLMNYCIPMFLSSNKYAVHFDSPGAGFIDLDSKKNNEINVEIEGARKTYQVVADDSWDNLMTTWTQITGRQPKLPLWAFGNFSSRFGYHSQREVLDVVNRYHKDKIPLDAVIIDLYWFGKTIQGTLGNLEFDRDSFPEPEKMIRDLRTKNIQTILVTEPFVLTTSNRWSDAVKNNVIAKDSAGKILTYDFYFGNTGLIDIFDEKAKKWFWQRYNYLKKQGVSGFWGDLGEPEVHPDQMVHNSLKAREVHNIYGHRWAEMLHSELKSNYPKERPFILMRAGSSGSQRFGLIPWSGDVNRTWGGMRSQPEISLQMGMQGIPFMHSDLGGFAGANDDPELYTRWLQYGVFQPIFRPHGQEEVPSEPVFKDNKTKEIVKKAIELRYKLLPYNYTLMYKASEYGIPLMRPVFFEDQRKEMLSVDSMYFWGNEFLIAPVFIKSQQHKSIHFPNSSNWYDFYTNEFYRGGTIATIKLKNESIPTFVKGGSFIPMIQNLNNTSELSNQNTEIHFYFDSETRTSKGFIYQDEYHKIGESGDQNVISCFYTKTSDQFEIELVSQNSTCEKSSLMIHSPRSVITKIKVNGKKNKLTASNSIYSLSGLNFKNRHIKIRVWYK
jgi:alpha-glucosidase (family GH31 glycosyl hydrolase)